jgi:hypothetical protein
MGQFGRLLVIPAEAGLSTAELVIQLFSRTSFPRKRESILSFSFPY